MDTPIAAYHDNATLLKSHQRNDTNRRRQRQQKCQSHFFTPVSWIPLLLLCCCCSTVASANHLRSRRELLPQARVVGGSKVDKGDHPYFVYWEGTACGGAVIHEDIVVSAAHCFNPANPPASRWLYLNSTVRNTGFRVRYMYEEVHPDYDPSNHNYDFVLLKTSVNMLKLSNGADSGVAKIPFNRDPELPEIDEPVLAVGYGQQDEDSIQLSNHLMDVMLYYVSNDVCAEQYYQPGKFVPKTMFCTGVPGGGKDTCKGDSGGPLVDFMSRELMGVVSWGEGCAREDYSGVNARISAAAEWIDQQICAISSFPPESCPSRTPPVSNAEEEEDRPGGSAGRPQGPNYVSGPRDSVEETITNPQASSNSNTPLSAGSGVGGSSQLDTSETFPGVGPMVATNAVTVNIFYNAVSQRVQWSLERENTQTGAWENLYQSSRGYANELDTHTFQKLPAGWYRYTLVDPRATASLSANDQSIRWTSIMGPRGMQVWGKESRFTQTQYTVYFEINSVGIPAWGVRPDV